MDYFMLQIVGVVVLCILFLWFFRPRKSNDRRVKRSKLSFSFFGAKMQSEVEYFEENKTADTAMSASVDKA